MSDSEKMTVGTVAALWRYPVKSMQGEELNAVEVTDRGLLGDRARALVEQSSGKIVSAKNPRKWPSMFHFRARYVAPTRSDGELPAVQIELPDGTIAISDQSDVNQILSDAVGHEVSLESECRPKPTLEEYWPDVESLDHRDTVTDEEIKPDSFFDGATLHLLTTATIDRFCRTYPQGRFEARRFRSNIVVATPPGVEGFVENDWVGRTVTIGDDVQLRISRPCPRCVMTTLPQGDLPKDTGILRTIVQENGGDAGVFVAVVRGGIIRCGDTLTIET